MGIQTTAAIGPTCSPFCKENKPGEQQTFIPWFPHTYNWKPTKAKVDHFWKSRTHIHTRQKMKEEHFVAEQVKKTKNRAVCLPFSGPPAFDLSTSCHACCLPVHPSLVQIKNNSRVKSQEISWRESRWLQFPEEGLCPAHAFTRTQAIHGRWWFARNVSAVGRFWGVGPMPNR